MRYILTICLALLASSMVQGQTLAQAQELYNQGNYEEAKPVFEKLVKQQPSNGNYNLWYGVCCLETGDTENAVKYLEQAVKRRVASGQLYLGQAYNQAFRFEDAIETFESYISDLVKRKRPTEEADALLEKSRNGLRQLRGVERVTVIDSMVVDKNDFLEYYRLTPESGTLSARNDFASHSGTDGGTVYYSEQGNVAYFSAKQDSLLSIFRAVRLLDGTYEQSALSSEINEGKNVDYPFMMPDGSTLYYAADGEGSMGGYDIFVTRYNSSTDTYLQPENVGMPFNSPFNDYMYVVDEFNNLGWFASDRYQPEGKVCIYVFIPNTSKQVYNYESMDQDVLISLSQLRSISDTWADRMAVDNAKMRLANVQQTLVANRNTPAGVNQMHSAEGAQGTGGGGLGRQQVAFAINGFVVDDDHIYNGVDDFHSATAKTAFAQYRQLAQSLQELSDRLDGMREQYAADRAAQSRLAPGILDLEKRVHQLEKEVEQAANVVRREEQKNLR